MGYLIYFFGFVLLLCIYYSLGHACSTLFRKYFHLDFAEKFIFGSFLFFVTQFLVQAYSGLSAHVNAIILLIFFLVAVAFTIWPIVKTRELSFQGHGFLALCLFAWLFLSLSQYLVHYEPKHWDEFTHWMVMPKQILSFDSASPSKIPFTQFIHYPPGLAISSIWLPSLFQKAFSPSWVLLFYLSLTAVFVIYFCDTVVKKMKALDGGKIIASFFTLLFFCLLLFENIYPLSSLVETMQCFLIGAIGLFLYRTFDDSEDRAKWIKFFLFFSFSWMMAYLIKPSTVSVVILFVYMVFFSSYFKVGSFKKKILLVLGAAVPFLILFYTWNLMIADMPRVGLFVPGQFVQADEGVARYLRVFNEWFDLFVQLIRKLATLKGIFLFIPLLLIFRKRINKAVCDSILFYFIIYSILLSVTYVTSFAPAEALRLASFDRYMVLPLFLIRVFVVIGVIGFLTPYILKYLGGFFERSKKWAQLVLFFVVIVVFGFTLDRGVMKTDRDYIDIYRVMENAKKKLVHSNEPIKISFILDDSACEANYIAKYVSISQQRLSFDLSPISILSNTLKYTCVQELNSSSFESWFASVDYAVVIRENAEFRSYLLQRLPACAEMAVPYMVIKNAVSASESCQKL